MSSSSAILAKYLYRRRLPHLQKADADLFVTFCTGARRILPGVVRDLVLEHCLREGGILAGERARATQSFPTQSFPRPVPRIHLHAIVVMPDHVHLLLRPLREENGWHFLCWTFCNASRGRPHTGLISCSERQAQPGKKSHSIMCCDQMRVWKRSAST